MVQLTGVADCISEEEARKIADDLRYIPAIKFNQFGSRIDVYYTPRANEPEPVVTETVNRVLAVLEQVNEHGHSIIF